MRTLTALQIGKTIRERLLSGEILTEAEREQWRQFSEFKQANQAKLDADINNWQTAAKIKENARYKVCLLYTSDAADE